MPFNGGDARIEARNLMLDARVPSFRDEHRYELRQRQTVISLKFLSKRRYHQTIRASLLLP